MMSYEPTCRFVNIWSKMKFQLEHHPSYVHVITQE